MTDGARAAGESEQPQVHQGDGTDDEGQSEDVDGLNGRKQPVRLADQRGKCQILQPLAGFQRGHVPA